jgi:hypothetical protein
LLVRHGAQKQGEELIAGGRKLSESVNKDVRVDDLTAVNVKMAFWYVTPCSLISSNISDEPSVFIFRV